jgi:cytochrome c oxidase accessory protein FixG
MKTSLPMYAEFPSSLRRDGTRQHVHPADVHGRFARLRVGVFAVLIALLCALPWLQVGGHPAVFIDIERSEFYLFGSTFNAQDFWLAFFPLSGAGFLLIVATALWGRVWCGYACPHTVFLEGVFRPIERWLEGPRTTRLRRNQAGPSFDKFWRKALKHSIYLALSFVLAHVMVSYFVSLPRLYRMVLGDPLDHPTAFVWAAALTLLLYVNFSWFREQLCLIVCPYGRLQSVLTDHDTVVIGYDRERGEPRGKATDPKAGACVDCNRCVVVCPTGIDIRNGLQIDCVGCARCIDACDEVMDRLGRPRGLIRYDSLRGLAGDARRMLRPRLALYAGLGVAGMLAASLAFGSSEPYEANVLRLPGAPPFMLEGDVVRNAFEVHLVNKRSAAVTFQLSGDTAGGTLQYIIAMPTVVLRPLGSQRIPVFVSFQRGKAHDGDRAVLRVKAGDGDARALHAPLLAPHQGVSP